MRLRNLNRLDNSGVNNVINIPSSAADGPSAWKQAAYGAKFLPVALSVQAAAMGVGILRGLTDWETVKNTYITAPCPYTILAKPEQIRTLMSLEFDKLTTTIPTEEFLCRVLLQDMILKKAPKWILQKCAPSKVHWVDSTPAKVARVLASSAAFSALHLGNSNQPGVTPSSLNMQLCQSFGAGLVLGALQEKTNNAWASAGLHLAINLFAFGLRYRNC